MIRANAELISMASSNDFFEYVQDQLSSWDRINKKSMFGVLGLYKDGLMFGIVAKGMVYLKVDDSNRKKFMDAGSGPLKVFDSNSEVPSYYLLPVDVLEDAEVFVEWAKESYSIQLSKKK